MAGQMDKIMESVLSVYLIAFAGIGATVALATANVSGLPASLGTIVTTVMPIIVLFGLIYIVYEGSRHKIKK